MLDHIFLTVRDLPRTVAFYQAVPPLLGITWRLDYDGNEGPFDHPDLKGFGAAACSLAETGHPYAATHVGFMAHSQAEVIATYDSAFAAGALQKHPSGLKLHYDPCYFTSQVADPDGHSLEFVYKSSQHACCVHMRTAYEVEG
ncbi:MAG: VOC family protein [Pseudorhodobacter sp.]|nr:VOC family protein [Pseudorhodobacter sp.]